MFYIAKFVFFISYFYVLLNIRDKILVKYFHFKKQEITSKDYKHVNKVHKWLEKSIYAIAAIVFIANIFFPIKAELDIYLLISFFLSFFGLRAFMEWKYVKPTYRHIQSISYIAVTLLLFVGHFIII